MIWTCEIQGGYYIYISPVVVIKQGTTKIPHVMINDTEKVKETPKQLKVRHIDFKQIAKLNSRSGMCLS